MLISSDRPRQRTRALGQWAYDRGVELWFFRPEKPIENCFVKSFNGRFRDECLNTHWFLSLADARRAIEARKEEDNQVRPHSPLARKGTGTVR